MSRQSSLSDNNKGDNEKMMEVMHRSTGIFLMTEENSGKPQLGDRLIKVVLLVITPQIPANKFGTIAQHVKEGKGKEEGKGLYHMYFFVR